MDALAITNDQLTLGWTLFNDRHGSRCVKAVLAVAKALKVVDLQMLADLEEGTRSHDIGKTWVPPKVIEKAGQLEPDERKVMQLHPVKGAEYLERLGINGGFRDVVLYHHERWDGGGYPEGLCGEAIPLLARIIAPIDTYDALLSHRNYPRYDADGRRLKEDGKFDHAAAMRIIQGGAGSYFDPRVVRVFLRFKAAEFR